MTCVRRAVSGLDVITSGRLTSSLVGLASAVVSPAPVAVLTSTALELSVRWLATPSRDPPLPNILGRVLALFRDVSLATGTLNHSNDPTA